MGLDSVVVAGWCRIVGVGLVVLIVECAVLAIMKDNGWEIVEDVVEVVVTVELWVAGLVINSSSIENDLYAWFVVCVSSWELTSRSGTRRSLSDSLPLREITSFSKMLCSVSLPIWPSMTCEM